MSYCRSRKQVVVHRPVVWVVGASRGIGREVAKEFASIGCMVVASARSRKRLISLEREIIRLGGHAEALVCDVRETRSVRRTAAAILRKHGAIDVLIYTAGVTAFKTLGNTSLAQIERIQSVNFRGAAAAIKAVLPSMVKMKRGWIINVVTTAATKTFAESAAYSASKAALMSLGNVLREEVRSHRIKVTNVYPGATNTEMWPKDERRKLAPRMMSARGVAEAILNIYQMPPDVVVEDIVLRPIGGDIG